MFFCDDNKYAENTSTFKHVNVLRKTFISKSRHFVKNIHLILSRLSINCFVLKVQILEAASRWHSGFCQRCLFRDGLFSLEKRERKCNNRILIERLSDLLEKTVAHLKTIKSQTTFLMLT